MRKIKLFSLQQRSYTTGIVVFSWKFKHVRKDPLISLNNQATNSLRPFEVVRFGCSCCVFGSEIWKQLSKWSETSRTEFCQKITTGSLMMVRMVTRIGNKGADHSPDSEMCKWKISYTMTMVRRSQRRFSCSFFFALALAGSSVFRVNHVYSQSGMRVTAKPCHTKPQHCSFYQHDRRTLSSLNQFLAKTPFKALSRDISEWTRAKGANAFTGKRRGRWNLAGESLKRERNVQPTNGTGGWNSEMSFPIHTQISAKEAV